MRFSGDPDTLKTHRSAVLFRFNLRNFKVKINAFAQKNSVKLNDKAAAITWEVK